VLRIGFSTSVGRGLLPRIQQHFARVRPNWRLQLRQVDWNDPTCGLRYGSSDLAIVWLPVPAADRFSQLVLVQEPRHVALRAEHRLAGHDEVDFSELLDEPFLALPEDAGSLRDDWLAIEQRACRPPRIGGIVTNAEETFEAVLAVDSASCCCPPATPRSTGDRASPPCPCAASHPAGLRCCGEKMITAKPSGISSAPPNGL